MFPKPIHTALFVLAYLCVSVRGVWGEPAKSADDFVDRIGVVTHLYGKPEAAFTNIYRPRLEELGVRHVSDTTGYSGADTQRYAANLKLLSENLGIRLNLNTHPDFANLGNEDPQDLTTGLIPKLKTFIQGGYIGARYIEGGVAVESIRSVNEHDHLASFDSSCSTSGTWFARIQACRPAWMSDIKSYTHNLYDAIKGDPVTQQVKVMAPPLVHLDDYQNQIDPETSSSVFSSMLPLVSWVDIASGNFYGWKGGFYQRTIQSRLSSWGAFYGNSIPLVASEFGWYTSPNSYSDDEYVSTTVQSKFTVRAIADAFNAKGGDGFSRVYIYELVDGGSSAVTPKEGSFGMVTEDGAPKPVFTTVKNLITLLSDRGSTFSPSSLSYSISAPSASIHHLLLQKRSGVFYLLLWNEISGTSLDTDTTSTVALTFSSAQNIHFYRPSTGESPYQYEGNATSTSISVPDDLIILEIEAYVTPTPTSIPSESPTPEFLHPGTTPTATPDTGMRCSIRYSLRGRILTGRVVRRSDGAPIPETRVVLQRHRGSRWTTVAKRTSNSSGRVVYRLGEPPLKKRYRLISSKCGAISVRARGKRSF